jgi:hypothetical protein
MPSLSLAHQMPAGRRLLPVLAGAALLLALWSASPASASNDSRPCHSPLARTFTWSGYRYSETVMTCPLWRSNVPVYSWSSSAARIVGYLTYGGSANWFVTRKWSDYSGSLLLAYHPSHVPFEDPDVHDSETVLSIERLPNRILIVGGGPVGSEFASIFSALGVEVTLVDHGTRLLPLLDRELSEALAETLRRSGARLTLGGQVELVRRDAHGLVARVDGEDLRPQVVLHAVGREGNVEGLGLTDAGAELDGRGRIRVDQTFQTTSEGIYSAGDVIGPPGLASVSMEQARAAMCHAFGIPLKASVDPFVPTGIYTLPEVGMIGLTEEAARTAGEDVETGRAFFAANPARGSPEPPRSW